MQKLCPKTFLNWGFSIENEQGKDVIIFPEILKILIFYLNCSKSASNVTKDLPEIRTSDQVKRFARIESL